MDYHERVLLESRSLFRSRTIVFEDDDTRRSFYWPGKWHFVDNFESNTLGRFVSKIKIYLVKYLFFLTIIVYRTDKNVSFSSCPALFSKNFNKSRDARFFSSNYPDTLVIFNCLSLGTRAPRGYLREPVMKNACLASNISHAGEKLISAKFSRTWPIKRGQGAWEDALVSWTEEANKKLSPRRERTMLRYQDEYNGDNPFSVVY